MNDTNIEIRIAVADVMPKLKKYRPTWPVMNATGRKITTSDSVVAMTASPISPVALMAASFGDTPFSSMYRKMFSSTTIASSMTMPVASENASIVMLFSVKPSAFITVNVPMIDVGMASAAMIVTR